TAGNVAGQLVGGFEAFETTHSDVFADLSNQCRTRAFHSALAHRERIQGSHVGGVFLGDQLGQFIDETDEVVVLGNKIGFAVNFDYSTALAVGSHIQADQAFGGDACGSLAGLVTQFYAENLFSTGQV